MESRFLTNPAASAHSVSLVALGGGNVGAAWFAGSREGAADVRVVFARFDGREWSPAKSLAERVQVQRDTGRLVRKVGNPVIWRDATGALHLWFVSVGYGGWGGSALNHIQSGDGGFTWSRAERLVTSPFFNISTLGHGAPLALADGGIALPVYHEFIAKRPEWLRLNAQGKVVDKQRLPGAGALLQPSAVALDDQRILGVLRDAGSAHRIRVAQSGDAGSRWTDATVTQLPNPNAGIALLRLADGRLLLASNPQEAGRNLLALQVSGDEGRTWSPPRFIEQGGADDEYSYPALLQDETGMIHLAYTWKREKIRHLRFSPLALAEPKR
jgi:predicted neuraminidase